MLAIAHAQRVLDWLDNLPRAETPPEWMWPFDDELQIWFDEVEEERNRKFGRQGNDDSDEVVPMMSNELAKDVRK